MKLTFVTLYFVSFVGGITALYICQVEEEDIRLKSLKTKNKGKDVRAGGPVLRKCCHARDQIWRDAHAGGVE